MRREKKAKPAGACSVCYALTNMREFLNHRCDKVVTGRRCYGVYKSSLTYVWDMCDTCEGYGGVGSEACRSCEGFGWRLHV